MMKSSVNTPAAQLAGGLLIGAYTSAAATARRSRS
jgi:hypothetical protein